MSIQGSTTEEGLTQALLENEGGSQPAAAPSAINQNPGGQQGCAGTVLNCLAMVPRMFALISETWWSRIGSLITLLAMIPQGIFGMLLIDFALINQFPNVSIILRLVVDAIIFFTATAGKFALIHFYNDASFRGLPKYNWSNLKDWGNSRDPASFLAIPNFLFTIVASGVFAYLASVGMDGAAGLARKYNTAAGNQAANYLESWTVKGWSVVSSFYANLLSWNGMKDVPYCPGMHKLAAWTALDAIKESLAAFFDMRREQERLVAEAQMNQALNPTIKTYNQLAQELKKPANNFDGTSDLERARQNIVNGGSVPIRDNAKINQISVQLFDRLNTLAYGEQAAASSQALDRKEIVRTLLQMLDTEQGKATLRERMLTIAKAQNYQPEISVGVALLGRCLGLLFTGLCVFGFTNFWNITLDMSAAIGLTVILPTLFAVMDMVSMSAMALLCTFSSGPYLLNKLRPEAMREAPQLVSDTTKTVINVAATGTAVLGGTPNGYQALVIVGQGITAFLASLYASGHVELGGLIEVMTSWAEGWLMPQLKKAAVVEGLGVAFEDLNKVVKELAKLHAPLPASKAQTTWWCHGATAPAANAEPTTAAA